MKYLLLPLILFAVAQLCYGQDLITLRNHKQINVRITEHDLKVVKYRMPDYEDGPVLVLRNSDIRKIEFQNGYTDLMGFQNPRKSMQFGISSGYGADITSGGSLALLSVDYFIIPQIDLEANIGTSDLSGELYYAGGSRFHVNSALSEHKLSPFTGILGGRYYGDAFIQIPAGVSYVSKKGLNLSLSINEMISFSSWQTTFIELRAGWRFRL
jgi:hypothetical protein